MKHIINKGRDFVWLFLLVLDCATPPLLSLSPPYPYTSSRHLLHTYKTKIPMHLRVSTHPNHSPATCHPICKTATAQAQAQERTKVEGSENDQPTPSLWYILCEKRGTRPPISERLTRSRQPCRKQSEEDKASSIISASEELFWN